MGAFQLYLVLLLADVAATKLYFTDCISNKGVMVSYGNTTSLITKDGEKAWSFEVQGEIAGNQIACGSNGEVYVSSIVKAPWSHTGAGHGNGTMTVLTSDGKVKWAFTTKCAAAWNCFSSFQAAEDGAVFVAS